MKRPARGGTTLVELAFFGALASVVAIAAVGLLARGNRLLELGRRTSASMEDARALLEALTRDTEELSYLESSQSYDSDSGGGGFAMVVRSSRPEVGLATPAGDSARRVEYKLGPATGPGFRPCLRTVSLDSSGGSPARALATSVKRLRIEPLVAVPATPAVGGQPLWTLSGASGAAASTPGSCVICLVVDLSVGGPATTLSADRSTETSLAVKLWCRNRLLQLPRGGTL